VSVQILELADERATSAMPISAAGFVRKWGAGGRAAKLSERAGAQSHFRDLCSVLRVDSPDDPENYCFERHFRKKGDDSSGYADVWKRGCFAWEYKAPKGDLRKALDQLLRYAHALDNPPLLVVSNRDVIEVHSHFTGQTSQRRTYEQSAITDARVQFELRQLFVNPDFFRPAEQSREITEKAASVFASTADRLRARGVRPAAAAHFLSQCVFCFFAEDVGLLPKKVLNSVVQKSADPQKLRDRLTKLFRAMKTGGDFGAEEIEWFNGGLFNDVDVPDLDSDDAATLAHASALDWSEIDPSIFGTLFERGLNPAKRTQLGAHYTDPRTIQRLVKPLVERPLLTEWASCKERIAEQLSKRDYLNARRKGIPSTTKALRDRHSKLKSRAKQHEQDARDIHGGFLERLREFKLLDPACGSGNFLYLGLKALKDVEHQVNLDAEELGLERQIPVTGPHNVMGLEVDEYAAELAKVTIWIGELQWRITHNQGWKTDPILEALEQIERRDALVSSKGEARWPSADVVLGNPPFLGNKRMRAELGSQYTDDLRRVYAGHVPGEADLVCYWFERAMRAIDGGTCQRAGLVATNSIRFGPSRTVLSEITKRSRIFEAWSDEAWVNDGAAVHVSLVCFGKSEQEAILDGKAVASINANITGDVDLTAAKALPANANTSFQGSSKVGAFEIPEALALQWLSLPNPHRQSNVDVLRPWVNGLDLTRRPSHTWIIDFGTSTPEAVACKYEAPYRYLEENVKEERLKNNREAYQKYWWRHAEARTGLRAAIAGLPRYIATPRVAKHRLFVFIPAPTLPDTQVVCIARADDVTIGVLSSRFHMLWSLRQGSSLEDRPRYTPTSCFETYPFPVGMSPADTASQRVEQITGGACIPSGMAAARRGYAESVAYAARHLNELREDWLNPPLWTEEVPSPKIGRFPSTRRGLPEYEAELQQRTLTNLYNENPKWLREAHRCLDVAVASAYGWNDYSAEMPDAEILSRLLAVAALPSERRLI
jgi:hypothetical protein